MEQNFINNQFNNAATTNSRQDESFVSLREILDKYSHNPELLNSILISKAEQDKLKAEELRYQTELLKFETKRMEYEMSGPKSPTNVNQPYMVPQLSISSGSLPNFNNFGGNSHYNLSSLNGASSFSLPVHHQGSFNSHMVDPDELILASDFNTINLGSPIRNEHKTEGNGIYKHQNPSREEVLTALRNKVRANSFAKAYPNHPTQNPDFTSSQESLHNRSASFDSKMDVSSSINQFLNTNRKYPSVYNSKNERQHK